MSYLLGSIYTTIVWYLAIGSILGVTFANYFNKFVDLVLANKSGEDLSQLETRKFRRQLLQLVEFILGDPRYRIILEIKRKKFLVTLAAYIALFWLPLLVQIVSWITKMKKINRSYKTAINKLKHAHDVLIESSKFIIGLKEKEKETLTSELNNMLLRGENEDAQKLKNKIERVDKLIAAYKTILEIEEENRKEFIDDINYLENGSSPK